MQLSTDRALQQGVAAHKKGKLQRDPGPVYPTLEARGKYIVF